MRMDVAKTPSRASVSGRIGLVGALALAWGAPAPANGADDDGGDEPDATASSDLRTELAWARAGWGDDLRGVHFHAPVAKLRAWVPPGRTIQVYVYTPEHACQRVELSRDGETDEGPEGAPAVRRHRLVGKVNFESRIDEDGTRLRTFSPLSVGALLSAEDGGSAEARGPDGRWQAHSSWGFGGETVFGALSSVDGDVARFGGDPVELHARCDGPFDWLPCTSGGERPCDSCQRLHVMTVPLHSLFGSSHHFDRPVTCQEKCPPPRAPPAQARLDALFGRATPWVPSRRPIAEIPAIYRSRSRSRSRALARAACLAVHFPVRCPPGAMAGSGASARCRSSGRGPARW